LRNLNLNLSGCPIIGEKRVNVENRLPIESQFVAGLHQELDSGFVIQNHLGLGCVFALGCLAELNEPLRVEQRIRIAFEP
jgi:hypothetical protein